MGRYILGLLPLSFLDESLSETSKDPNFGALPDGLQLPAVSLTAHLLLVLTNADPGS